jgi:hypothetical protein
MDPAPLADCEARRTGMDAEPWLSPAHRSAAEELGPALQQIAVAAARHEADLWLSAGVDWAWRARVRAHVVLPEVRRPGNTARERGGGARARD